MTNCVGTDIVTVRWVVGRIRNILYKIFIENQTPHFIFNKFSSRSFAIHQIIWINMVQAERPEIATN